MRLNAADWVAKKEEKEMKRPQVNGTELMRLQFSLQLNGVHFVGSEGTVAPDSPSTPSSAMVSKKMLRHRISSFLYY